MLATGGRGRVGRPGTGHGRAVAARPCGPGPWSTRPPPWTAPSPARGGHRPAGTGGRGGRGGDSATCSAGPSTTCSATSSAVAAGAQPPGPAADAGDRGAHRPPVGGPRLGREPLRWPSSRATWPRRSTLERRPTLRAGPAGGMSRPPLAGPGRGRPALEAGEVDQAAALLGRRQDRRSPGSTRATAPGCRRPQVGGGPGRGHRGGPGGPGRLLTARPVGAEQQLRHPRGLDQRAVRGRAGRAGSGRRPRPPRARR